MRSPRPAMECLIGSTAFLILVNIENNEPKELEWTKLLFLRVAVHWLIRLREVVGSVERHWAQNVTNEIHSCANQTMLLLKKLTESLRVENSSTRNQIISHLRLVTRITSKKSHMWTEYLNKLVSAFDELWQGYSRINSLSTYAPKNCHTIATDDRISLQELRSLVISTLSSDSALTESQLWKLAFEKSNIMALVQLTLDRFPESPDLRVNDKSPAQQESERNACAILNEMKGVLAKMRALHTVCLYFDHETNEEESDKNKNSPVSTKRKMRSAVSSQQENAEENEDSSMSTSKRSRSSDSFKIPTQRAYTVRSLVSPRNFEQFVGSIDTPASSPQISSIENKWVVKLHDPTVDQKRVPWTVEESIALWHGVFHNPGRKNWSEIWRRSFRQSIRTPVHLKDRWRVLERNSTVYGAIADAYQTWTTEHKQVQPNGTVFVPVPVIIHDSKNPSR
ncbi:hypothetical protein FGIG_03233 [Fasciola gigantica]|uniref:Myb-like domain-containing protein n=1 Tax=Fasciola gigantica TaxID=46835 RepID=A0A504YER4_FASGI|nr:hypothetical protein FGIG_03233 [Fasciola gigantica]